MLVCVRNAATTRKLRLFACACCRQAWNPFVPPIAVAAVEVVEAVADGHLSASVLGRVHTVMTRQAEIASHSTGRACILAVDSHLPVRDDGRARSTRRVATLAAFAASGWPWTNYSRRVIQQRNTSSEPSAEQAALAATSSGTQTDRSTRSRGTSGRADASRACTRVASFLRPILADALRRRVR